MHNTWALKQATRNTVQPPLVFLQVHLCFSCFKKSKYLLCKGSINSTFCHITFSSTSATYHPKGPGSCLSKFQNMKPENKERTSLFGRPAEISDQRIKTQKPQTNQMYESYQVWLLLFIFFEHFFLWITESIPHTSDSYAVFRQADQVWYFQSQHERNKSILTATMRCMLAMAIFHVPIISLFPWKYLSPYAEM